MSWYNPSQDEAAEEYYMSKNKYNNAANQRCAAMKAAENCNKEKKQALLAIDSCMSDKLNFEKRIEEIRTVIGAIDGSMGGSSLISAMGGDVPSLISQYNTSAQQTDESYKGSIKSSDQAAASIFDVFKNKSVEEDNMLSTARQLFLNEVERLQEALRALESQINSLHNLVDELTAKVNAYNVEQMDWRKVMISSAFEMNHFKGYM